MTVKALTPAVGKSNTVSGITRGRRIDLSDALVGSATFRYFELFTLAALFYIVCVQLIGVVWRVISGRAARAPLGI